MLEAIKMQERDYKELYFKLFRATEKAINLLIDAQRECEELYLSGTEEPLSQPAQEEPPKACGEREDRGA